MLAFFAFMGLQNHQAQAFNYCVVRGASNVCPNDVVDYEVLTGGIFVNHFVQINVSGGSIIEVVSLTYANPDFIITINGSSATVDTKGARAEDFRVRVHWNNTPDRGRFYAAVRFNVFGEPSQWNSDEISVLNGLGAMGDIQGSAAVSCAATGNVYTIGAVEGATEYRWFINNVLHTIGQSCVVTPTQIGNSATLRVTAYNMPCGASKTDYLTLTKTTAQVSIQGETGFGLNNIRYFTAYDMASGQQVNATELNWSLSNSDWTIIDGQGSAIIGIQAPNSMNSMTALTLTGRDACGRTFVRNVGLITSGDYAAERVTTTAFSVYPNPTADIVTLKSSQTGTLYITNQMGEVLQQFDNVSNGFQFSVAKYPTDTYLLRFVTKTTVEHFRLAVHHN